MTIPSRFSLLLLLSVVLILGCESSRSKMARLSGTVKYKGKPVTAGMITLSAKEGGVYPISINSDGTFASSQLPVGEYGVAIETETANPKLPKPEQYGGGKWKGQMTSPMPEEVAAKASAPKGAYVPIPKKYADPKTSGLTVTLNKGENKKDFELTD